jgi:predicted AAA+ superfamily ATPase
VHRAKGLFPVLRGLIDMARRKGRRHGLFLLLGSAGLDLLAQSGETLAGRISYLELGPLTLRETGPGTLDRLWLRGGFPESFGAPSDAASLRWRQNFVRTYLERDLQDLSSITALPDFRRLMRAACHRLGQMLNQTELGRDVGLPQPTVHRYLNLLETSFLLVRISAFATNRTKRLIKTPKLYWGDTGVALYLSGLDEPGGAYLENIVLNDLLAWRDASAERIDLHYWRTVTGDEIDFVIESGGRLLPIEVKSTSRPRLSDAAGLRAFRAEYGKTARAGLLLHAGQTLEWLAPDILAAPWWRVL